MVWEAGVGAEGEGRSEQHSGCWLRGGGCTSAAYARRTGPSRDLAQDTRVSAGCNSCTLGMAPHSPPRCPTSATLAARVASASPR